MEQIQTNIRRYEKKFLLTEEQYALICPVVREHMDADRYGVYPVCSVYYDTETFSMIRTSLEKPVYKEKFRLRSYGVPKENDLIFAEIKKKYKRMVSKRRIAFRSGSGKLYEPSDGPQEGPDTAQNEILEEIRFFFRRYQLEPKVFIGYRREAYTGKIQSDSKDLTEQDLRVTFDRDLTWRMELPDLQAGDFGAPVLNEPKIVMEIKTPWAVPLWLAEALSGYQIVSSSFSKYGVCYAEQILPQLRQEGTGEYA